MTKQTCFRKEASMNKKCCMSCTHLIVFEGKDETKYVCALYGKRIIVEPEVCEGYEKGGK